MKNILTIMLACSLWPLTAAWAQGQAAAPVQQAPQVQQAPVQAQPAPVQAQPVEPPPQAQTQIKTDNGIVNLTVHVKNDSSDDDDDTSYFSITLPEKSKSSMISNPFSRRKFMGFGKRLGGMGKLAGSSGGGGFVCAPAFTIMNGQGSGFSIDIGGRAGNNQFMGNFTFASGSGSYSCIGTGFVYEYYAVSAQTILNLAPGVTAGFWSESWKTTTTSSGYYGPSSVSHSHDRFYVGGPSLKLEIGYGQFHLFAKEIILFGSAVNLESDFGMMISL